MRTDFSNDICVVLNFRAYFIKREKLWTAALVKTKWNFPCLGLVEFGANDRSEGLTQEGERERGEERVGGSPCQRKRSKEWTQQETCFATDQGDLFPAPPPQLRTLLRRR
ncbi:hypothetical protein NL108_003389 [Boleophthalmus pectinirostris]|nr:hypothetical protein NL108_003389 [Boleophthalmus pectinirostris]